MTPAGSGPAVALGGPSDPGTRRLTPAQRQVLDAVLRDASAAESSGRTERALDLLVLALDLAPGDSLVLLRVHEVRSRISEDRIGRAGINAEALDALNALPDPMLLSGAQAVLARRALDAQAPEGAQDADEGSGAPPPARRPALITHGTSVPAVVPDGPGARPRPGRPGAYAGGYTPPAVLSGPTTSAPRRPGRGRTRWLAMAALVLGVGGAAYWGASGDLWDRHRLADRAQDAQRAYAQGQLVVALDAAQAVVNDDPSRVDMWLLAASVQSAQHNGRAAALSLREAESRSADWKADLAIARVRHQTGDRAGAAETYYRAFTRGAPPEAIPEIVQAQREAGLQQRAERIQALSGAGPTSTAGPAATAGPATAGPAAPGRRHPR